MTDETQMTKAELLANIEQGWNDFQAYLASLTYEQVTIPTDPAGWTAKDHIAHLAIWEDSLNALLEKKNRREYMGITDEAVWQNHDWDAVNAVIQQRYQDITVPDLQRMFFAIHEKLVGKINAMSDADLQRPYAEFQSDWVTDRHIIHWLIIETYEHYDEHKDYIDMIAMQYSTSVAHFLEALQKGWDALWTRLNSLSDVQRTQLTDAAGWTVKDHVAHLALWEDSINALLEKKSRQQHVKIDDVTWNANDIDRVNAVIQQRYRDLSWEQVEQMFQEIHSHLIDQLQALSDADLLRPHREYDPQSSDDSAILGYLVGNSFGHYAEHRPWIKAIAES